MTIYLHIGTGKTGTTSIQTFLEANTTALRERGIVVPTSAGRRNHRRLTMHALNDDVIDNLRRGKRLLEPAQIHAFRAQFEKDLRAEAATWGPDETIVFTSEQMTRLRRPGELERLRNLLDFGHDIKIIVYFRRQDEYYVSEYSQEIKGGKTKPMKIDGEIVNPAIYNYDVFLSNWARVFPRENIIVRPYERCQLKDGDVVADFMQILGVDDLSPYERPAVVNQSLDIHTIEFLRQMNPHIPRFVGDGANKLRDGLAEALEEISVGPKPKLPPEGAQSFLEKFARGNSIVAREYMGRADGVLFKEGAGSGEPSLPTLTVEQAAEIAAKLWVHLRSQSS